jgi:Ca2+/Na+ antiporter
MGLSALFVDVVTLPDDGYGFVQLLMIGAAYCWVLMQGSHMISDGSELLLLIPAWAGLVGSLVLPVLASVPDAAIVLFSGLGPDPQQKLSVGIGALAGSTIMVLTVPWFLSIWAGRVDFNDEGKGQYVKPKGAADDWTKLSDNKILGTGVNVGPSIRHAVTILGVTLVPYVVIQIPAMFAGCTTKVHSTDGDCDTPKWAALVAGVMTVGMFAFYLWDQNRLADTDPVAQRRKEEAQRYELEHHMVSLQALFAEKLAHTLEDSVNHNASGVYLMGDGDAEFKKFIRPYFKKFDTDNSGDIDAHELKHLLEALGEYPTPQRVADMMAEMDKDNSGSIDFEEFAMAMEMAVLGQIGPSPPASPSHGAREEVQPALGEVQPSLGEMQPALGEANEWSDGDNDEEKLPEHDGFDREHSVVEVEETEEMPEDLAHLSPEEQQRRLLRRAFLSMFIGTLVVVLFSDPMVDVLNNLGTRTGIPAFYVAFVVAPFVSNGSELIASYAYASKKTEKTVTISFATLIGSAAVNNTLVLGIFLFIVVGRNLKWVFTAEVTSIVVAELCMVGVVFVNGRTMKSWIMFGVAAIFPLALVLVFVLENVVGLD